MKIVDDFLARRRAQKLRVARSLPPAELAHLIDELVAAGPGAMPALSECLSHGEARAPALEALDRLLTDATFERFLDLLCSPNPTVVSGAARVLSASRRFDARRLLKALAEPKPAKSVLEPILREHVAAIPIGEMVAMLPGLSREGQAVLLRLLDRVEDPHVSA